MKRDELKDLVRDPSAPGAAETAARVYADDSLWPAFEEALYPDAQPSTEDAATIRRFVDDRCRKAPHPLQQSLDAFVARRLARLATAVGDFALAAAPRAGGAARAPSVDDESPVTFVFVSETAPEGADRARAWRAEMTLPPDARVDTLLAISLVDGTGAPVDGGLFRVAGASLPIARGRAEIPYGLFLTGLKDAKVERVLAQGGRVPGTLALF